LSACPQWTMADLVAHVGEVHAWGAGNVSRPADTEGPQPEILSAPKGSSGEDLVQWFEQQSANLLEVLGSADLERPCWTFGEPHNGHFWTRRMALETTVHAWDATQASSGGQTIETELACDGLEEFFSVFLGRRIRSHADRWQGETIHLHQTDGDHEWLLTLGPNSLLEVRREHAKGDLAVRGRGEDLYLWSLNRDGAGSIELFGDTEVAERWSQTIKY
jgi:uncharacterized protein (TIGR03083 family)